MFLEPLPAFVTIGGHNHTSSSSSSSSASNHPIRSSLQQSGGGGGGSKISRYPSKPTPPPPPPPHPSDLGSRRSSTKETYEDEEEALGFGTHRATLHNWSPASPQAVVGDDPDEEDQCNYKTYAAESDHVWNSNEEDDEEAKEVRGEASVPRDLVPVPWCQDVASLQKAKQVEVAATDAEAVYRLAYTAQKWSNQQHRVLQVAVWLHGSQVVPSRLIRLLSPEFMQMWNSQQKPKKYAEDAWTLHSLKGRSSSEELLASSASMQTLWGVKQVCRSEPPMPIKTPDTPACTKPFVSMLLNGMVAGGICVGATTMSANDRACVFALCAAYLTACTYHHSTKATICIPLLVLFSLQLAANVFSAAAVECWMYLLVRRKSWKLALSLVLVRLVAASYYPYSFTPIAEYMVHNHQRQVQTVIASLWNSASAATATG